MPVATISHSDYPTPTGIETGQAKQIICDIIASAGGELQGKTRLYKLFYYAHLDYYATFEGLLSTYPIVRMTHGPGIDRGDMLLEELKQEGLISIEHDETDSIITDPWLYALAEPYAPPESQQTRAIRMALARVRGKTALALSQETHEKSWSWQDTPMGKELNIYLDLLPREEYERIGEQLSTASNVVDEIFSGR